MLIGQTSKKKFFISGSQLFKMGEMCSDKISDKQSLTGTHKCHSCVTIKFCKCILVYHFQFLTSSAASVYAFWFTDCTATKHSMGMGIGWHVVRNHQLPTVNPHTGTMSIPSPTTHPDNFLEHLRSLGLDHTVTTFTHHRNQPACSPSGWYHVRITQEWYNQMDSHFVSCIQSPSLSKAHSDCF